jgi:uncharacterized protein YhaN
VAYRAELEALDAEQPDDVAQRAQTARAAAAALAERLEAVDGEARDLAARLEERGQDGLEEALDSARSRLAQARRESASLELRAGAARHLRDTLVSCRDAARDAYSRPLRERIEELSRALFGPSFQIELSDDLRIASRTLDGQTLPFAALSTGTREQLSLIARLAGALLVADDGGAPVILDDTLGSCDAERLTAMASILALAGRRCQVLVLTCFPERFRSVTGARVIRLGPAGRVAGERSALVGSGT